MGVTVQFYLIAPLMFKGTKQYGTLFFALCAAFTIAVKAAVFLLLFWIKEPTGWDSFFAGRQLFTALDNFAVGMYVAYLVQTREIRPKQLTSWILIAFGLCAQFALCKIGCIKGIHTNNFSGYTWHTAVALTIGVVMFGIASIPQGKSGLFKAMLRLSEREYVVYLWHLPVYENIIGASTMIEEWKESKTLFGGTYLVLISGAILVGFMMSFTMKMKLPLWRQRAVADNNQ